MVTPLVHKDGDKSIQQYKQFKQNVLVFFFFCRLETLESFLFEERGGGDLKICVTNYHTICAIFCSCIFTIVPSNRSVKYLTNCP